jgi:hypothetical protein
MKIRVFAACALAIGMMCGCSDPKGGTNASTGSSASSDGDGGSGSGSSGSTSGSGSSGSSGGSGASTGTDHDAGPSCPHGVACTYDNDCGGSLTCLNECCEDTNNLCRNGSAAYGPCAPGWTADIGPGTGNTGCCVLADGGTGGGTGGTGGTGGSCDFDGGNVGGVCVPDCNRGFHCQNGVCQLNGGGGPIQVTLHWGQGVDLDLHVIEPSGCEVYYGDTNRPAGTSSCGAVGSLDLDSNPGCSLDNVDIENVIYPAPDAGGAAPPPGTYTVRVDNYEDDPSGGCTGGGRAIPYQVVIRHGGVTDTYCESFAANSSDQGGAGAGHTIATFTYP